MSAATINAAGDRHPAAAPGRYHGFTHHVPAVPSLTGRQSNCARGAKECRSQGQVAGQSLTRPQFRRGAEPPVLRFVRIAAPNATSQNASKRSRCEPRKRERLVGASYAATQPTSSPCFFRSASQRAISPEIDPRARSAWSSQWIYNYRAKPDYAHVPAAVRVLFHAQSFKEPENAGIYLGFIAGAIGSKSGQGRAACHQLIFRCRRKMNG